MKKIYAILLVNVILLAGCGGGGGGGGGGSTGPSLSSIAVAPANNNIPVGQIKQFTATGTFSDGSTQDLTSSVTWSSSAANFATITSSGMVTTVAAGSTTITATMGSKSGSTGLVVSDLTVPPGTGTTGNMQGTWIGTYTITYYPGHPSEVGIPYGYQFVLVQNGTSVTGTATLRGTTISTRFEGTVTGNRLDFHFTYNAPWDPNNGVNDDYGAGTVDVTGTTMAGESYENYNNGFGGTYTFNLVKQ